MRRTQASSEHDRDTARRMTVSATAPSATGLTENQRGIGMVLLGMSAFAIGDAFVKLVGSSLPLGQIVAVRGLMASALLLALVLWREGMPDWRRLSHPRVLVRSLFEVGATVCFLSAIVRIPLANATAIIQAIPLAVTFCGALFLGEKVGWRRYSAILVGFMGILVIVRPGTDGFDAGALFAIGTVACSTGRDLVTRRMPSDISSLQVVLITTLLVTLSGVLWMGVEGARAMSGGEVVALALAAVALPIGLLCVTAAVRIGELAVITPFRYSIFLWALLIGWLVFGEVPDTLTFVGTAIVLASGLYTLMREAKLKRDIAARSGKRGAAI